MKGIGKIACVIVLLLFSFVQLDAKGKDAVKAGDRVRITTNTIFIGTLVESTTDTLVLKIEDRLPLLTVPVDSVRKLEVDAGSRKRIIEGAALGFVAGVVIGEVICASYRYEDSGTMGPDRGACGLLIGGPALGLAGGFIGAKIKTERWQEVPVEEVRK